MNAQVLTDFTAGSGVLVNGPVNLLLIFAVGFAILWAGWTLIGLFKLWAETNIAFSEFLSGFFRTLLVVYAVFYVLA